jgi:hypothetical protein
MAMELTARICIAAGVGNLGAHEYWTRVMECFAIDKREHTEVFLLDKTRLTEYKQEYKCRRVVVFSMEGKNDSSFSD